MSTAPTKKDDRGFVGEDAYDIGARRDMARLRKTPLAFIRLWLAKAAPFSLHSEDTSLEQRLEARPDDVRRGPTTG